MPRSGHDFPIFVADPEAMSRPCTRLVPGVQRSVASLVLALSLVQPADAAEPLHIVFAQCLGLLSAEMEHHWLMQDARAEATEAHRATLIALTDAATPVGLESRTMHIRLEAKFAHKALLARAAFNDDPDDALWAAAQAESAAARCVGLLLS